MKIAIRLILTFTLLTLPIIGRAETMEPQAALLSQQRERRLQGFKKAPADRHPEKRVFKEKIVPLGSVRNKSVKAPDDRSNKRSFGAAKASSDISMTLSAYCSYAQNYDYANTFDEIEDSRVEIKWFDAYSRDNDLTVKGGFFRDGTLYQLTEKWDFDPVTFEITQVIALCGLDSENGEILSEEKIPSDVAPIYDIMAYDEADDFVYGYGVMPGYEGEVFMRMPYENLSSPEYIASVGEAQASINSFCWNPVDDCFYGINSEKEFIKIEKTGKQTVLFNIGMEYGSSYYGALIYSVADKCFYWNINFYDGSALAKIDPETAAVDIVFPFEDENQFVYFVTTDSSNPEAPIKPTLISLDFLQGSTSGTMVCKAPEMLVNGDAIPVQEALKYNMKLDGTDYQSGNIRPGEEIKVDFTNLADGEHIFQLAMEYKGIFSSPLRVKSYIGFDTPNPPADVVLSTNQVSWTKVDSSEHGGYVAYDQLEYMVYINDELYGITKSCTLPIELPSDKELSIYTASVSCKSNGKESEKTISNMLPYGQPFSTPYFVKPTMEQALLSYVWDSNNDGISWSVIEDGPFYISYSQTDEPHDDWVVLPPVKLTDTEAYYTISFDASIISDSYPQEFIEVALSENPTPKGMKQKIVDKYQPTKIYPDANRVNALIKIDHPGTYYLGIHAISEPDQAGMTVGNISIIDNNIRANSPKIPEDICCVPGEKGSLEAKVTFKFPAVAMNGTQLPEDAILQIKVTSPCESKVVSGIPGEKAELSLATLQGDNVLTFETSLGDLNGPETQISVYTGIVAPKTPVQISTITHPDNTSMTITWEKVCEGVNNGFLIPENIVYDVYRAINMGYYIQYEPLDEGLTETSYTYTLPYADSGEFLPQENITLAVAARNEAGTNGKMAAFWDVLGTPYSIPFIENLEEWNFKSFGWYMYAPNEYATAEWVIDIIDTINPDWGDPYHGIITCKGDKGTIGMLGMPRISTFNVNHAALYIEMYTGKDAPEVKIFATTYGNLTPKEIGCFKGGDNDKDGLNTVEFPLPDYLMNKGWIQIYIQPEFTSSSQLFAATSFSVTETSGISIVTENENPIVAIEDNGISVKAASGESVFVYDMQGRQLCEVKSTGSRIKIPLEGGMYIVKIGKDTHKIMVR